MVYLEYIVSVAYLLSYLFGEKIVVFCKRIFVCLCIRLTLVVMYFDFFIDLFDYSNVI